MAHQMGFSVNEVLRDMTPGEFSDLIELQNKRQKKRQHEQQKQQQQRQQSQIRRKRR